MQRSAVLIVVLLACVQGRPWYQDRIPNGKRVTNPCNPEETWPGVGHENKDGGGIRNPFGRDFAAEGSQWTSKLCNMDSDNDGYTNGYELGDPDCRWTQGSGRDPDRTTEITHPGICDLWNDPKCLQQNSWLNCDKGFKCDAIQNSDTKNITFRLPETKVPAKETTYICSVFELPKDRDYHMIATVPQIDNVNVMHHIVVYGCNETDQNVSRNVGDVYDCSMLADRACTDVIGIWGYGFGGVCLNEQMGFRIGGEYGYSKVAMQLHWNNPEEIDTYTDSSGMTLYYTPNLRPYDGGMMQVGQQELEIPPNEPEVTVTGNCSSFCSDFLMRDTVYITGAINHMHYLGKSMKIELNKNMARERYITDEPVYNYDNPQLVSYGEPIEFRKGDEIKTTCVFNSVNRNRTTFYGEATSDEMCIGFLIFYPRENMPLPYCFGWRDISQCELWNLQTRPIQGCNLTQFLAQSHPKTSAILEMLSEVCEPFQKCSHECMAVVKELKKNPCLSGTSISEWHKRELTQGYGWMEQSVPDPLYRWRYVLAAIMMDSCDGQLGEMKGREEGMRGGKEIGYREGLEMGLKKCDATSSVPIIAPSVVLLVALIATEFVCNRV